MALFSLIVSLEMVLLSLGYLLYGTAVDALSFALLIPIWALIVFAATLVVFFVIVALCYFVTKLLGVPCEKQ